MPSITSGRFAAATSIVALVVAMGGTGYAAAGKITGHDIKKNAISSAKVKNDSLTGKDIKESTLGQVPSAATAGHAGTADSATTATTAGNASKVDGSSIAKVTFRTTSGAPTTVFSGGGLVITAACDTTNDLLVLNATTTKNDSSIYTILVDDETPTTLGDDMESDAFDVGDNFDLTAGANSAQIDPAVITFGYTSLDGTSVTGILTTDTFVGSDDACLASGNITVS